MKTRLDTDRVQQILAERGDEVVEFTQIQLGMRFLLVSEKGKTSFIRVKSFDRKKTIVCMKYYSFTPLFEEKTNDYYGDLKLMEVQGETFIKYPGWHIFTLTETQRKTIEELQYAEWIWLLVAETAVQYEQLSKQPTDDQREIAALTIVSNICKIHEVSPKWCEKLFSTLTYHAANMTLLLNQWKKLSNQEDFFPRGLLTAVHTNAFEKGKNSGYEEGQSDSDWDRIIHEP